MRPEVVILVIVTVLVLLCTAVAVPLWHYNCKNNTNVPGLMCHVPMWHKGAPIVPPPPVVTALSAVADNAAKAGMTSY